MGHVRKISRPEEKNQQLRKGIGSLTMLTNKYIYTNTYTYISIQKTHIKYMHTFGKCGEDDVAIA